MSKKNQKGIIYNIVRFNQPIRTERVKILAMQEGISCADRYLRWLRNDGHIIGKKFEKDNTKTWRATDQVYEKKKSQPIIAERGGQFCMVSAAACFCLASVILFRTPVSADVSSGKTMTKKFEGWRSTVYVDPAGVHQSIGYGFNIDTPRVKKSYPRPFYPEEWLWKSKRRNTSSTCCIERRKNPPSTSLDNITSSACLMCRKTS